MKQNAKLPLSVAREPLEKYGLQQVIMLCMDANGVHHIVTYGKDKEQCNLSSTVPRYMNQKAFHINTVQEMIHVSRLPFFTH